MIADQLFDWGWAIDHLDEVWSAVVEHVALTALAVGIGMAISLPVGVYAYRHRRAYAPVTWVAGILYTIPSLALFAFLVPLTGLSYLTAEIGLVSYTLLILIRNVVAGLDGVPQDAREAATGMGYTDRQLLWRVELPLAAPVIVAGLRIATVTTIGLVTVTALIGLGGLGIFILRGLGRFFNTMILLGAVLSAALALVADWALTAAQRQLTPWARRQRTVVG
ncbi:MAG: ABC transporter permease [Actinobacteria bacterium]|nr:ABC transporter permease [Actinomycetota bacterium]